MTIAQLINKNRLNPVSLALQRARSGTTEGNQQSKLQGIANKMAGIVIKTDPRTTAKGNTTCAACRSAKATGSPLPPEHPNCRCTVKKI